MSRSNAYTKRPPPRSGFVAGSFQLLVWFLLRREAWQAHIDFLDPSLPSDFALPELSPAQWRHPGIRRLLGACLMHWIVTVGAASGAAAWGLGLPLSRVLFTAGYAAVIATLTGLLVSSTVSLAAGLAGGVAAGLSFGVMAGILAAGGGSISGPFIFGPAYGVILGLVSGLVGYVATTTASKEPPYSWLQQLRQIVATTLISAIFVIVAISFVNRIVASEQQTGILNVAGYTHIFSILGAGVILGTAFGIVVIWRTLRWRRGLAFGLFIGTAFALLVALLLRSPGVDHLILPLPGGRTLYELRGGEALFVLGSLTAVGAFSLLLSLTYVLVRRIAGAWAGAVAGTLATAGFHLFTNLAVGLYDLPLNLGASLVLIVAGLTMDWWRPVLFYLFESGWNLLLYRIDSLSQGIRGEGHFLRYHAAFWDDYQYLPLVGLARHLLLVARRNPQEGQAAMDYLLAGSQRWAVEKAEFELTAGRLTQCRTIEDIRALHQTLKLERPKGAGSLFNDFNQYSKDVDFALNQTTNYHRRLALGMVANQLQEAGNGFKLDSRPEMVRFYPITVRWRQIIGGYMDELTAAIEASQEIDNPYVFGAPLTEKQEIFVGRTDIIERIEQHLLDTNRPSILLYGQRRMGKTSLLRNLRRLFQSDIVPLFVDVQGASLAGDYPDLLYNIARQVRRSAEQYGGNELPAINRERLVESPFTTLIEWLDLLEKALAVSGYRLALLAFDEIEALHHVGKRGRFDETDFLSLLRHLTQTTGYYKVLLASSRTLQEFPGWSAYLVNLQAVKISYLNREEARQLVERPVESFKLRYEAEAAGRILLLTRGHPFLVQLLCHEIVSYKNRQPPDQRRLATTADVEAAVPNALEVGQLFFEDIAQNQIGETGQAILRELAFYDNGSAGQQDLSGRFGGGFEASLALLRQRDLIEIADGRYRFQVELIRRWFQGQS